MYGRRRVGKTALITEFCKEKTHLYFLATEESESENRNAFKEQVANFTGNELLENSTIHKWDLIFKDFVNFKTTNKKILVIDEFQYLGKSNSAFPSIFQKVWDTYFKNEDIMVIICGSLINMMVSQTLLYDSPLYGRCTGQIKLQQIPFLHYNEFFPSMNEKDLIFYYAVTGGVPKYIELFNSSKDIYKAIEKNILSTSSFLYEEPTFLLQREVNEIGSYFSIIKTIAAGNHKLSKIATALEQPQTGLTKYLKTLIDLDILKREVPITEENPEKSKKGLYFIKDNYINFWFKFIYPYKSLLETGREDFVINKIKKNFIYNHVSFVYEDICIEKMWAINGQNDFGITYDRVGRWWGLDNIEIDIIAYDSTSHDIVFCECKFSKTPKDIDVFYSLEEKSKSVPWNSKNRKEYFILFSINGFTEKMIALSNKRKDILLLQ